nr:LysR family substrate-binding domain-containing protein [Shinella sp. NM-101]
MRKLKGRSSRHRHRLTLGLQASPSAGNMPTLLGEFTRRFPAIDIRLVDGSCQRLLDGVRAGTVDIAIVTGSRSHWSEHSLDLWSERVVAALPAHHPLALRPFIQWRDLNATPILLPEHGPGADLHQRLSDRLTGHSLPPILHHDAALDRILALVRGGLGILLVMEGATGLHYEGVAYREIRDGERPERLEFSACWSPANRKTALMHFLATLRERHPDLAPPDLTK